MSYIAYRSISDMNEAIIKNISKLPHDIDLVVGIPRSGMLPANLIALYLNKPFTDIDSFIEGKIYSSGERGKNLQLKENAKILLIDDSIASGKARTKAFNKLESVLGKYQILFGVVYATSSSKQLTDFHCEIIDSTRVFQWNIFHHYKVEHSYFDMDGVLCEDPKIDDDGPLYIQEITNAKPKFIPTVPIDTIVTCRLEKYRDITEKWLKDHGVQYKNLIMMPYKTKEERLKHGNHGAYKAEHYKKNPEAQLFFESNEQQAQEIRKISGKPVFCTETFSMSNSNIDGIKSKIVKIAPRKLLNLYFKLRKK